MSQINLLLMYFNDSSSSTTELKVFVDIQVFI